MTTQSDTPRQRYEKIRVLCLRYGNLHPDSKEVCHQALNVSKVESISQTLALELDDMYLVYSQQEREAAQLRADRDALAKALRSLEMAASFAFIPDVEERRNIDKALSFSREALAKHGGK